MKPQTIKTQRRGDCVTNIALEINLKNHSNISPDCVNSRGYGIGTYDAGEMSLRTSIPLSHRRKPSDATTVAPDIASSSARGRRLYVGNLLYNINGDQLGFVQFVRLQDTRAAQILNGQLDIGGRVIKVSAISAHVGMQDIGAHTVDYDDDDDEGGSIVRSMMNYLWDGIEYVDECCDIKFYINHLLYTNPNLMGEVKLKELMEEVELQGEKEEEDVVDDPRPSVQRHWKFIAHELAQIGKTMDVLYGHATLPLWLSELVDNCLFKSFVLGMNEVQLYTIVYFGRDIVRPKIGSIDSYVGGSTKLTSLREHSSYEDFVTLLEETSEIRREDCKGLSTTKDTGSGITLKQPAEGLIHPEPVLPNVYQLNEPFQTILTDVALSNEPCIPQLNIYLSNELVLTNVSPSNKHMLTNVPLLIEPEPIIGQTESSAEFQFEPQLEQVKDLLDFRFKSVAYTEDPYASVNSFTLVIYIEIGLNSRIT
ncbi:hypothetical protein GIB67_025806 [Kingdonia uniflora]|uniref:RRM domain-containing protein n=1 Tax=Kingdonia uniflora TaxID=39325 RepID=A0A7J7NSD6_9MAGN|nr:hypothetical protein GIB67_025806 [Kingdonia uniflora]